MYAEKEKRYGPGGIHFKGCIKSFDQRVDVLNFQNYWLNK